jgi:hypothetical protein
MKLLKLLLLVVMMTMMMTMTMKKTGGLTMSGCISAICSGTIPFA